MVDYLDPDVAYLLGMITARGMFQTEGDIRRLLIRFPYRLDSMNTLPGSALSFDRETELRLCLDDVRRRINELLEVDIEVERLQHEVALKAVFTKNTMSWRNLQLLCDYKTSYREFEVHEAIRSAPEDMLKEFLRGIADTSAEPSAADHYMQPEGRQRIVIQFQHDNWTLPIQVCHLLQVRLGVPVQEILWGHPNTRAPKGGGSWAKEHRMRIFAEDFRPIGFGFRFKQLLFEELARWNEEHARGSQRLCNPKVRKVRNRKPRHPDEGSERLPCAVRRHFNAAFKVCVAMGCQQGRKSPQLTFIEDEDENANE
ncbi:MAG TPA: hypothetical protein PLE19_23135 [Planctomycetota bacterium]|nr:hypothetical protein [Planctomycetota bacterium]HRR78884.1 hypothetical protein [Planctomycetota bacterium]HRT95005.1 hypothetical protein [Planctomycetota bacterium]